jgi:hypothetical protein
VHHEPDTISRRGGAIVNGLRLTWPLVSLTVTPASLHVATLSGARYELRREEIARLTLKWRHLWPGIQIEHTRTDLFSLTPSPSRGGA